MAVSIVQSKINANTVNTHATHSITLDNPVDPTHTLILICVADAYSGNPSLVIDTPSGWTSRRNVGGAPYGFYGPMAVFSRIAGSTDQTFTVNLTQAQNSVLAALELSDGVVWNTDATPGYESAQTTFDYPAVTPTADVPAMLIAASMNSATWGVTADPSGYTRIHATSDSVEQLVVWAKAVSPTSGTYGPLTATFSGSCSGITFHMAVIGSPDPNRSQGIIVG